MLQDYSSSMATMTDNGGTPRSKIACRLCRANKVRCMRENGDEAPCIRCGRFGLPCTDPPIQRKRGRPAKTVDPYARNATEMGSNHFPIPLDKSSNQNGLYTDYHPADLFPGFPQYGEPSQHRLPITAAHPSSFTMMPSQHRNWMDGTPFDMSPPDAPGRQDRNQGTNTNQPVKDSDSTPRSTTTPNEMAIADYLDPDEHALKAKPQAPFFHTVSGPGKVAGSQENGLGIGKVSEGDDPISLRIVSEAEANALIQLFHERLNPLVAVLDRNLHTLQYLRNTSTVLLSTVLASASRFFRKDLHRSLLPHAQTMLDRAILSGTSHIGIAQGLMMTYWKSPADTSAWKKIGMAIRMGYQLRWHLPRLDALPDNDMAAREVLNAERTWFCLFCFDRSLSQTFGLPTSIRLNEIGDAESWARGHLYLGPAVDMHLAASIELCKLKDHWREIFSPRWPSPAYCEAAIDNMSTQCDALITKWFTEESPPPDFHYEKEHIALWCTLDFLLIIKRHHLELEPADPLRLDACLLICSRIVDEIEILANGEGLTIMQDTGSCMTSSFAVFLRRIFRHTSHAQKTLIISLLQRILQCHNRVSAGSADTATAYVARCIRRILGAIGDESRAASPPAGVGPEDNQPDFLAQLEEFMQMPQDLGQGDNNDDQYWQMLFSAS